MKSEKLHPIDSPCFEQVANVIGYDAAVYELQRVIDSGIEIYDDYGYGLIGCFVWTDTPQGNIFWDDISSGRLPIEYKFMDKPKFTDLTKDQQEHFILMLENAGYPPEDATHVDFDEGDFFDCECWLKIENGIEYFWTKDCGWDLARQDVQSTKNYPIPQKPWYDPADVAFTEKAEKESDKKPAHEFLESAAMHLRDRASERDTGEERSMKSCVNSFNAMYADIVKDNNGNLSEELGWMFMVFLKASRAKGGKYRQDDYEDGAAYFALAGESASIGRK